MWQIGEIASRIGQLYYQFYLRKGDTCYLDEAYVFYEAIRARQYLGDTTSPGTHPDLAVLLRRLRYYTRFCVVCLLTGRRGRLLELLGELDQLVHSKYSHSKSGHTKSSQRIYCSASSARLRLLPGPRPATPPPPPPAAATAAIGSTTSACTTAASPARAARRPARTCPPDRDAHRTLTRVS